MVLFCMARHTEVHCTIYMARHGRSLHGTTQFGARHDIVRNYVVQEMNYVVEVPIAKTMSCSVSCDVVSCDEVCRAIHEVCRAM